MKRFSTLIIILFTSLLLVGQSISSVILESQNFEMLKDFNLNTKWVATPKLKKEVFSFAIKSKSAPKLSYRTKTTSKKISNWKSLEINSHRQKEDKYWVSELYFLSNETDGLQFRHQVNDEIEAAIEIFFIEIPKGYASEKTTTVDSTNCECNQPAYYDRAGWCPDNDCPEIMNPAITDVTHLIVHHAASANTSTNWAGVVRSIWDFHVNINGWDDIGYNWLVDPEGQVYQGRGDNVRGAHFCGTNSGTAGICMLGNFQTQAPQDSAIEKLTKLLAWKACDVDIFPRDSALHNSSDLILDRISGHRQGCSTSCPGDLFFPLFPELRMAVENYIADSCETTLSNTNIELEPLEIRLFPNPASEYITIESDHKFTFTIVDINGEIIKKGKKDTQRNFKLELSNFSEGIYFLNIKSGEHRSVKKFNVLRAK